MALITVSKELPRWKPRISLAQQGIFALVCVLDVTRHSALTEWTEDNEGSSNFRWWRKTLENCSRENPWQSGRNWRPNPHSVSRQIQTGVPKVKAKKEDSPKTISYLNDIINTWLGTRQWQVPSTTCNPWLVTAESLNKITPVYEKYVPFNNLDVHLHSPRHVTSNMVSTAPSLFHVMLGFYTLPLTNCRKLWSKSPLNTPRETHQLEFYQTTNQDYCC